MNILLYQPKILSEKDCVFKNGQLLSDSSEYNTAYDTIVNLFEKAGSSKYPWVGRVKNMFVIRGIFDEIDEKGRTLVFLYATDNPGIKEELCELSQRIGYKVTAETFEAVDNYMVDFRKNQSISKIAIPVIIIIVFLLITLCNR